MDKGIIKINGTDIKYNIHTNDMILCDDLISQIDTMRSHGIFLFNDRMVGGWIRLKDCIALKNRIVKKTA